MPKFVLYKVCTSFDLSTLQNTSIYIPGWTPLKKSPTLDRLLLPTWWRVLNWGYGDVESTRDHCPPILLVWHSAMKLRTLSWWTKFNFWDTRKISCLLSHFTDVLQKICIRDFQSILSVQWREPCILIKFSIEVEDLSGSPRKWHPILTQPVLVYTLNGSCTFQKEWYW